MLLFKRFPLHMEARLIHLRHKWVTFWKVIGPPQLLRVWYDLKSLIF